MPHGFVTVSSLASEEDGGEDVDGVGWSSDDDGVDEGGSGSDEDGTDDVEMDGGGVLGQDNGSSEGDGDGGGVERSLGGDEAKRRQRTALEGVDGVGDGGRGGLTLKVEITKRS